MLIIGHVSEGEKKRVGGEKERGGRELRKGSWKGREGITESGMGWERGKADGKEERKGRSCETTGGKREGGSGVCLLI